MKSAYKTSLWRYLNAKWDTYFDRTPVWFGGKATWAAHLPLSWAASKLPLRMRQSLKGYTVMAVTSWSYRGKSGRECSAVGFTCTFEWVCGLSREGRRIARFFFDFHWRNKLLADLSSLQFVSFRLCQERYLSGVSDNSNFAVFSPRCRTFKSHCYPRLPFDPNEENRLRASSIRLFRSFFFTWSTVPGGFWEH